MDLPAIDSIDLIGKRVIVRGDLDVDLEKDASPIRLQVLLTTLNNALEKGARQVVIVGHRGRPDGKKVEDLSNRLLIAYFSEKLHSEIEFAENVETFYESDKKVRILENLRFWAGEESNSEEFAQKLSAWGDVFVNESFGVSHREHASIVGLPKLLPHAAGYRFAEEVKNLHAVRTNPKRPLLVLLSGAKEDKLEYLKAFKSFADLVMIGGRLPVYLDEDYKDEKVVVSRLIQDKEDITIHTMEKYEEEIKKAGTIIVSGPVGKFEEEGHRQGTERVYKAVADSEAYKLAGGGDTEAAISFFKLEGKFDWISTGGGAMLDYLATGTLPGIEALIH